MERTRSTRGANSTRKRAPAPKKKAPKKKSADRVKDEDDSDLETGSAAEKSEKKKTGGFHVCLLPREKRK
jgi:upstream activation factor subunit UAF30